MARKALFVIWWLCGPMAHDPAWGAMLVRRADVPRSPCTQGARPAERVETRSMHHPAIDPCAAALVDLDDEEIEEGFSTVASSPAGDPTIGCDGTPRLIRPGSGPVFPLPTVRTPLRC